MNASDKEKGETLLRVIGVGDTLAELDRQEAELYSKRRAIGQIAEQKAAMAEGMPFYAGAPEEPVSATELIRQQQDILARLASIEETNRKVRANLDREKAYEDAKAYTNDYNRMTAQIEDVRAKRRALLESANLPLPGLSVENGLLTYNGCRWDCMSASEQLRVATAIVRELNPKCGFVLLDKLEQMDAATLEAFGDWLAGQGLQAIATRVSTGEECTIIIEDGIVAERPQCGMKRGEDRESQGAEGDYASSPESKPAPAEPMKPWTKGAFCK